MSRLGPLLRRAVAWIDARAVRERAFLLAAALAVGIGGFVAGVWDPLAAQRSGSEARAAAIEAEVAQLEAQASEILARHERDPDTELRARRDELLRQAEGLDARIRAHTVAMLPPAEVARFLERVLAEHGTLELVALRSLGAEPLLGEPASGSEAIGAGVYRHGFELEVRGDYLGTLAYLRALEALPWSFFWESLDFEVIEHPRGLARIRAWTLGAGEEWLGV